MSQVAATVAFDRDHWSAVAKADMAGKADRFVKLFQTPDAGTEDRLAFAICGIADEPDGILADGPDIGEAGNINRTGRLRIELGGTVTALAEIGPDANGKGVLYGAGAGYAIVLAAGVSGDIVDCVWLTRRRRAGLIEANDLNDALNVDAVLHTLTIGAGADAATMGAGRYIGQTKWYYTTVDGGGSYEVTSTFLTGVTATTKAKTEDVGDYLFVMWTGATWRVILNNGFAMS